jgi:hypothetical protein
VCIGEYYLQLASGHPVAVKRITDTSLRGEKDFMIKVSIISLLRQKNVIQSWPGVRMCQEPSTLLCMSLWILEF